MASKRRECGTDGRAFRSPNGIPASPSEAATRAAYCVPTRTPASGVGVGTLRAGTRRHDFDAPIGNRHSSDSDIGEPSPSRPSTRREDAGKSVDPGRLRGRFDNHGRTESGVRIRPEVSPFASEAGGRTLRAGTRQKRLRRAANAAKLVDPGRLGGRSENHGPTESDVRIHPKCRRSLPRPASALSDPGLGRTTSRRRSATGIPPNSGAGEPSPAPDLNAPQRRRAVGGSRAAPWPVRESQPD